MFHLHFSHYCGCILSVALLSKGNDGLLRIFNLKNLKKYLRAVHPSKATTQTHTETHALGGTTRAVF